MARSAAVTRLPAITKGALTFNGTTQTALIPAGAFSASDYNGACTWSLWARWSPMGSNTPVLDNAWGTGNNVGGVQVYISTNYVNANTYGTSTTIADGTGYNFPVSLKDGQWIHILFTKNVSTTTQKLYINGVLVSTNTGTTGGANPPTSALAMGARGNTTSFSSPAIIGSISDIACWNRDLSAAEAMSVYLGSYSQSGLVRHWDFHEGSGTTVSDLLGGPSFSLVASPVWSYRSIARQPTPNFGRAIQNSGASNGYLTIPSSSVLLPAGDWTVEAWMIPVTNGYYQFFFEKKDGSGGHIYNCGFSNSNTWFVHGAGTSIPVRSGVLMHYAQTYKQSTNTYTLYLNGVAAATNVSIPTVSGTNSVFIMKQEDDGTNQSWKGMLDELRFSSVLRYTANFSPPLVPFVSDANTILLMHLDETGTLTDSSSNAFAVTTNGSTLLSIPSPLNRLAA